MIKRLPLWNFNNLQPAFNDLESATAVEMVYKLYNKFQELIDDYNAFVTKINEEITNFENDINANQEYFQNKITKLVHDYIATIDMKIACQDKVIADAIKNQDEIVANAVEYMKTNIVATTTEIVNQAVANGDIILQHTYDEVNKKVSLIITNANGGGTE